MTQPELCTRVLPDPESTLRQTAQELEAIVRTLRKATQLETEARHEAREADARVTRSNSEAAREAANRARERLCLISDIRRQAGLERRAAQALYQEQKRLAAAVELREAARSEALASFERQWERDYERTISERNRNIELLRRWLTG